MKRWPKVLFLVFLFFSQSIHCSHFYDAYLGENQGRSYVGPFYPSEKFDSSRGVFTSLDEIFYGNYALSNISQELIDLEGFILSDLLYKSQCTDKDLYQNSGYIQYLFRLISISYIFESMTYAHLAMDKLGYDKKKCSITFKNIFSRCTPKTQEMKTFIKRQKRRHLGKYSLLKAKKLFTKSKESWASTIYESDADIVQKRLQGWCSQNKVDCRTLTKKDVEKALIESCSEDRNLILRLCSEQDKNYGSYDVGILSELLKTSEAIKVMKLFKKGPRCIERYSFLFRTREQGRFHYLAPVFRKIYQELKDDFQWGDVFISGALREFDDLGLENFLFEKVAMFEEDQLTATTIAFSPITIKPKRKRKIPSKIKRAKTILKKKRKVRKVKILTVRITLRITLYHLVG